MLQPRPCPICSHAAPPWDVLDFHKTSQTEAGAGLPLSGEAVYYHLCEACGYCFAPALIAWSPEDFKARIYNEDYEKVDPAGTEERPTSNAEALQALFQDHGTNLRHLDYGGGQGLLSQCLSAQGWDSSSYDPLLDRNLDPADRGPFDLVTAFEVFAHVPDPQALLRELSGLVAEQGILLFSTQLSDGHLRPDQRLTWDYAAPRNGRISLFSREALTRLAGQWGFRCSSLTEGLHVFWKVIPPWAAHLIDPLASPIPSYSACQAEPGKWLRIRQHLFHLKREPDGTLLPFELVIRMGDLVAMMICAQYMKLFEGRSIVFQLLDETHKRMRAEVLFRDLIDEIRTEEGPEMDFGDPSVPEVYDPGPLWVASTFYHQRHGGRVIPHLSLDPAVYTGPPLPEGPYLVFHPLFDPTYNKPRGMADAFVNALCEKLHAAFGAQALVVTEQPERIRSGIRVIASDNLYDLAYIIGRATVHLGGDTGFTHLAAAARVPHLYALYGHNYTHGFARDALDICNSDLVNPFAAWGKYWGTGFDCRPKHDPEATSLQVLLLENNGLAASVVDALIAEVRGPMGA